MARESTPHTLPTVFAKPGGYLDFHAGCRWPVRPLVPFRFGRC
jgi:hypothetical protein